MKYKVIEDKYKSFILNIKNYFSKSTESIHKARNEIKIVEFENKEYAVKAFKIPNAINKVAYAYFRNSKAKKSYENSVKIIDFVPKPIGYIENYSSGLLKDSYFVSENFNFDFTIREPLLEVDFPNKNEVFKAFARFTFELHENNVFHLDYSPGNILIKEIDGEYIFKIVDINRMQFKELSKEERLLNFSKLWAQNEDLEIIVKEYLEFTNYDRNEALSLALEFSYKHKEKTENKKKLKKLIKGKKNG